MAHSVSIVQWQDTIPRSSVWPWAGLERTGVPFLLLQNYNKVHMSHRLFFSSIKLNYTGFSGHQKLMVNQRSALASLKTNKQKKAGKQQLHSV